MDVRPDGTCRGARQRRGAGHHVRSSARPRRSSRPTTNCCRRRASPRPATRSRRCSRPRPRRHRRTRLPTPRPPTTPTTASTTVPVDQRQPRAPRCRSWCNCGPPPSRPVRMLVAGDSTALYVGQGLAAWSLEHPDSAQVGVTWCQGCTFMLEPEITTFDIPDLLENSRATMNERLPDAVRTLQPDVVVLMVTVNDVANRRVVARRGTAHAVRPALRRADDGCVRRPHLRTHRAGCRAGASGSCRRGPSTCGSSPR